MVEAAEDRRAVMAVEFWYDGPNEIGHWEPCIRDHAGACIHSEPINPGYWKWVVDVSDSRRWKLYQQEDPEALIEAFIQIAKAGARIRT